MSVEGATRNITRAHARLESWSLREPFVISREAFHEVVVAVVELGDGDSTGRGECCPVARYGETPQSVLQAIESMLEALRAGADWNVLHDRVPPGAARNAVDCAVWDLRAKQHGAPVWSLLGMHEPRAVESVLTISLADPETMAAAARAARAHGILKLKLGAPGDARRAAAVRAAAPDKRLIADVNEGWSAHELADNLAAMADCGIEMVEQPLPVGADEILGTRTWPLAIGADESCHVSADVERLRARYQVVNIKLDKTGGLTEALRLLDGARAAGLETMVGCMLGTSLAMAPATLIAQACRYVDLDAPLLIGSDRAPALIYEHGFVQPPSRALWG